MMRLSSFGCTKPEHLLQRLQTTNEGKITIGMQFVGAVTMAEAIESIESSMDIEIFDCHVRNGSFYCDPPFGPTRITFRSTVQPKCKAYVIVSPETYVSFINDLESSGLWEYEGESPTGESPA